MKTLLAVLLTLPATVVFAQEVDVDVGGMVPAVKMKVRVSQPTEAAPPPNQGPRQSSPKPPPPQVVGAESFDISFEMKPRETLRLLSPEGAHAEVWADDGSYLGGYDLPTEVGAKAGQFYRVVISGNGALIFDRKVELRQYYSTTVSYRGSRPAAVMVVQAAPATVQLVDFEALTEAVKAESFGDAKLDVVRTSEGGLTVDQLGQLVDLFSFSSEQVKVVEIAHRRLVDPQNAFKLYSHFTFDGDKKKVKAILGK